MALKTDYKNDIFTGNRKYNEITNSDGTISLEDVTEYTQEGDTFSATDINATNEAINDISNDVLDTMEEIEANTESGAIAGALALKAVNENLGGLFSSTTQESTITVGSSPTIWWLSQTRTGYTPISATLTYNNSTRILAGIEELVFSNGSFTANGFAKDTEGSASMSVFFKIYITWVKNI